MGYCRIVQYGDTTEIYEYEKNRTNTRTKTVSSITRKRNKQNREYAQKKGTYIKSYQSKKRTINNFFKLCHHNNCLASTIHFFTLTFIYDLTYQTATRHVARFMERIKKNCQTVPLSYISVSEKTKAGRYHFHLLVYDLPTETESNERKTRYFQRQFERGYVDIRYATYTSAGIAGYMAKYMSKSFTDESNETGRYYNCSRNIKKISAFGSNTLDTRLGTSDNGLGFMPCTEKLEVYTVPYLGTCIKTRIINKI